MDTIGVGNFRMNTDHALLLQHGYAVLRRGGLKVLLLRMNAKKR